MEGFAWLSAKFWFLIMKIQWAMPSFVRVSMFSSSENANIWLFFPPVPIIIKFDWHHIMRWESPYGKASSLNITIKIKSDVSLAIPSNTSPTNLTIIFEIIKKHVHRINNLLPHLSLKIARFVTSVTSYRINDLLPHLSLKIARFVTSVTNTS